jgi:acetyl-CoA carboxylase carboxyl transferase subunit beta
MEKRKRKIEHYKKLRDRARNHPENSRGDGGAQIGSTGAPEAGSTETDKVANARLRAAQVPENLFAECPACKESFTRNQIRQAMYICPGCGHYYPMPPEKRIRALVDADSFKVFRPQYEPIDPLQFEGYLEKKSALTEKTHYSEAILSGVGKIEGRKAVIVVMNSKFMMGSMGIEVGELVTLAIEHAARKHLPLIIFTASGGARMQEGILSLMQMAKTSAAMERFQKKGGLYIAYMTHPTTGGVSASFAGLGDITLAEPKALIGFAGPRVIEQTIGQKLPEGFQRAEYLEEHGFVDQVVERTRMRAVISQLLRLHEQ